MGNTLSFEWPTHQRLLPRCELFDGKPVDQWSNDDWRIRLSALIGLDLRNENILDRCVNFVSGLTNLSRSLIFAYFAYRARQPHRILQNMVTFVGAVFPSEYCLLFLALHSLLSFASIRQLQKHGARVWPTSSGWTIPNALSIVLDALAFNSLLTLTLHNLFARFRFQTAMRNAGIELKMLRGSGWSLMRLLLVIVPLPILLARNIVCHQSLIYNQYQMRRTKRRSLIGGLYQLRSKRTSRSPREIRSSPSISPSISPSQSISPSSSPPLNNDDGGGQVVESIQASLIDEENYRISSLKLDVYYHKTRRMNNAPVLLYIHGGGWVTGHRNYHSIPLLYQVARAGWVVVSINYRLCTSPGVRIVPEQLSDCKRALAWIRTNAFKYGADGSFVICSGESAGGHLATLMTLTPNEPEFQPGFEEIDTYVNGCINLYGVMDLTDTNQVYGVRDPKGNVRRFLEFNMRRRFDKHQAKFQHASPYWRVHPDGPENPTLRERGIPPIMIVHGTLDTLVPIEDAHQFWQALQQRRACERIATSSQSRSDSPEAQDEQAPEPAPERGENHNDEEHERQPSSMGGRSYATAATDVMIELAGTHHAFNFLVSPRTLSFCDAAVDFLNHVYRHERPHALVQSSKL